MRNVLIKEHRYYPMTSFMFQHKKATQTLNFFARQNATHKIGKLKALKLVYLADRYHLRKYGRSITNDAYIAMQYGPVASSVKDIADQTSFLEKEEHDYARQYLNKTDENHNLSSKDEVDSNVFSKSDLEALSFIWDKFHKCGNLVSITHEFTEWKKHEEKLKSGTTRIAMDILDFLKPSDSSYEYCPLSKDDEETLHAQLLEERELSSFLA